MPDTKCPECGEPMRDPPPYDPRLQYEPGCRSCYNEPELADAIIATRLASPFRAPVEEREP